MKLGRIAVAAIAAGMMGSVAVAQQPQGSAPPQGSTRGGPGQVGNNPQSGGDHPSTAPRPTDKSTNTSGDSTGGASQAFVRNAAIDGMAEVELAQLASQKASSDQVKQFAQRMAADHAKANEELKSLAQTKGITVPTDIDAKHKQTRDKLAKLSGDAFDRAYMDEMRKDHKHAVSEFQKQSTSGSDQDVKAWAGKTLPVLQQHMQMAERTHEAVATTGTTNSKSRIPATGNAPRSGATGTDRTGSGAGRSEPGSTADPGKDSPPTASGSGNTAPAR